MIRIGIVGCGRILAAHLRGYRLLRKAGVDNFRITALCARREDDARMYVRRGEGPPQRPAVSDIQGDPLAIGDEYLSDFQDDVDVKVYTDYRQMIAEGPIDVVNDFTIHSLHHKIAADAFLHDKDLLTQKPLALTVAAARQMCRQADERGRIFAVFENFRNALATRYLRYAFESGIAGRPQMVLMTYAGVWWAPDRIVAETPWRHVRMEGGGISLDLGVHFFDQIRRVAGEVQSVSARTAIVEPKRVTLDRAGRVVQSIDCDADDTLFAQFDTDAGAVGNMAATWGGHGGATRLEQGIVYYGSQGRIAGGTLTLDDGRNVSLSDHYWQACPAERRTAEFPLELTDSFALNQYDWLEAVRTRREPETSGREGMIDLATAYAIVESAAAGRTVRVADVLSGAVDAYQRPINEHFGIEP